MNGSNDPIRGCKAVLVVEGSSDDTRLLQVAAQETCPDVGFHFVPDGFKALHYLNGEGQFADRRTHPFPNVVLVDVRLPDRDGFGILDCVRRISQCDGLKVLAWSDGPDPRIAAQARNAGADYFVPKPFSFDHLMEEVARICALARVTNN